MRPAYYPLLLPIVFAVLLLGCREEVVEELESYGVKREWIPFADQLGVGPGGDYYQQLVDNSYPWFSTQLPGSPYKIVSTEEARSGKRALMITAASSGNGTLWLARRENIEDLLGHRVRFTAWLKPVKWYGTVKIGASTSRSGSYELEGKASSLKDGDWTKISTEIDVFPTNEFLLPMLEIDGQGTLYLDDCTLEILGTSGEGPAIRNTPAEHRNLGFEEGNRDSRPWYEVRDSLSLRMPSWQAYYYQDEYRLVLDSTQPHSGRYCGGFASVGDKAPNPATFYVSIPPEHLQAHKVKFTLWIKAVDLQGIVTFSASAWGKKPARVSQHLWEMQGTTGWKQYSLELEVPEDATNPWVGIGYSGKGTLLVDDLLYERVKQLPFTTGYKDQSKLFARPYNMDFESP